jgi:hypothetical protein
MPNWGEDFLYRKVGSYRRLMDALNSGKRESPVPVEKDEIQTDSTGKRWRRKPGGSWEEIK